MLIVHFTKAVPIEYVDKLTGKGANGYLRNTMTSGA